MYASVYFKHCFLVASVPSRGPSTVHSPREVYLGCSRCLETKNRATVNLHTQAFLSPGRTPGSRAAALRVSVCLILQERAERFQGACNILPLHQHGVHPREAPGANRPESASPSHRRAAPHLPTQLPSRTAAVTHVSLPVLPCRLCVCLAKRLQISCSGFNWAVCFLVMEFRELFT